MEAVGQLTGGMAHDFNNLLTIIIGRLDDAIERTKGELQMSLGAALRAAERGAQLTHRLLAFARQQPLHAETLDLNEIVAGMTELLRAHPRTQHRDRDATGFRGVARRG